MRQGCPGTVLESVRQAQAVESNSGASEQRRERRCSGENGARMQG